MSQLTLSERARNTPASPIRRLSHLAADAKARGIEVYHLNIGQPDIPSPKEFFDGIMSWSSDVVGYESSEGNLNLRAAWSSLMNDELGLNTTPEQMLITMGASEALVFVFMTCCDPGDEVIIFDPTYANYIGFAAIAGVTLVPVHSTLDEGFAIPSREAIAEKITPRTKAILLCSPNNPTGTVYTRSELEMLLEICNSRDLFFVVDETYRELIYDGRTPLSVLNLDHRNDRIVVVDSLSKRYSLCGARIGCMVTTNGDLYQKTLALAQARLAAPSLEQAAAAYMLRSIDREFFPKMKQEYEVRRDILCESLSSLPELAVHIPGGAFYTVVRLPVDSAEEFSAFLLRDFSLDGKTVFLAPARGFYMGNGRGMSKVRIAYVVKGEAIRDAVRILGSALKAYQERE